MKQQRSLRVAGDERRAPNVVHAFALALAVAGAGCPKGNVVVDAGTFAPKPDAGQLPSGGGRPGGGGVGGGMGAGGGAGAKRFQPPVVYLDGTPIAMLTFGELPPTMETTWLKLPSLDQPVRRFSLAKYLLALGVDLKKLKAAHLYSGRERVAILTGEELQREAATTFFSFTQSDKGKVQMRWPSTEPTTDRIDKVVTIALYVDKKPPERGPKEKPGLFLDGVPVDEPPYVTTDVQGGTRVYVDGLLRTILRPRDLLGEGPHPLLEKIRARGVAVKPQAADFVMRDSLGIRLASSALEAAKFTMPTGAGGLMRLEASPAAGVTEALDDVSAVLLYEKTPPPDWSKR